MAILMTGLTTAEVPTPVGSKIYIYFNLTHSAWYGKGSTGVGVPLAQVLSVNGHTGAVVLGAATVGAMASTKTLNAIATANPTSANVSLNTHKLTHLAAPTTPSDAVTKAYADAISIGLAIKSSAQWATTGVETFTIVAGSVTQIAGTSIDGNSPAITDRVTIKNAPASTGSGTTTNTNEPGNGIYKVVSNTGHLVLTRTTDMDTGTQVPGAFVFVEGGTKNKAAGFVVASEGPFTIGTTPILWTQFSGAGEVIAGAGLSKTGNTLSVTTSPLLGGTGKAKFLNKTEPTTPQSVAGATAFLKTLSFGGVLLGGTAIISKLSTILSSALTITVKTFFKKAATFTTTARFVKAPTFTTPGKTRANLHVPVVGAVTAVATTNIASLSGPLTTDGVALVDGNEILLTAQTTKKKNGPWVIATGAWTRPTDFAATSSTKSRAIFVVFGTTQKNTIWQLSTSASIVITTGTQTWVQSGYIGATPQVIFKPKNIEGTVYVDKTNTQGWSGTTFGAWVNAAWAYIKTTYGATYGGRIFVAPGVYNYSTPIVLGALGASFILEGSGDGNGATIFNYTGTSGIALSVGGGSGNAGGVQIRNFQLNSGAASASTATAISWGISGVCGCAGATASHISIGKTFGAHVFTKAETWLTNGSVYGIAHWNCKVQFVTTGVVPYGENNTWFSGLLGSCVTAYTGSNAGTESTFSGVALDANTGASATAGILTVGNASHRFSSFGSRFENPGTPVPTDMYVKVTAGVFNSIGDKYQSDATAAGTHTGFVTATGGIVNIEHPWIGIGSATPTWTQLFNASSPADIRLLGPLHSTGSTSSASPLLPAAYARRLTAAKTMTTVQTLITSLPLTPGTISVGETFELEMSGTQSANSGTITVTVHLGTAGTTADALLSTATAGIASGGGGYTRAKATIRTTGSGGTAIGEQISVGSTTVLSTTTTALAVNTTVSNIISMWANVSTGTFTAQVATLIPIEPTSH